eukprot:3964326-Pyramimonas_sp.AAC.1
MSAGARCSKRPQCPVVEARAGPPPSSCAGGFWAGQLEGHRLPSQSRRGSGRRDGRQTPEGCRGGLTRRPHGPPTLTPRPSHRTPAAAIDMIQLGCEAADGRGTRGRLQESQTAREAVPALTDA